MWVGVSFGLMTGRLLAAAFAFVVAAAFAPACTSKSNGAEPSGGAVPGPADAHCAGKVTAIDQAQCTVRPDADAGGGADDFGDALYGTEGDDVDCKYHATWSGAPVRDALTKIALTVVTKTDGKPLTGAATGTYVEAFLGDHPAPDVGGGGAPSTEGPPGTYAIPVWFDRTGRWTVRFHIASNCFDAVESSPHGHVAFYVNVP